MLAADSTPQANIAHPFASTPPERPRQRRDPGSFVARRLVVTVFRRRARSFQRCVRSTDAKHTTSLSTHDSFGDLDRRAFARGLGVWRASRRSSRFGDPLALPAGDFLPRGGSPRATRLWCPRHRRSSPIPLSPERLHALSRLDICAFDAMFQERRPRPLSLLFREKGAAPSVRGTFHRSRTNDPGILANAFVDRRRSRGFATAIRPPTPLHPARSPALG
jgi:hypothetical protein